MPFAIRPATPSDAPVVAALIDELADYERMAAQSHPDASALARHMAGLDGPTLEVFLATDAETYDAIGFALFFQTYSTFLTRWGLYMEDLYVKPAYRGRGVGRALVRTIARTAVARNCTRLEWSVLNWNDLAINFYKTLGAEPMREWTTWRLSGDRLKEAGLV